MELANITKLREKCAKDIAEAERLNTIATEVSEALGLTDDNWSAGALHVHKADCFIRLSAPDLPAALELCERMKPEPLARVKGTFLGFYPMERISEKEHEQNTVELITPYIYKLGGLRQYQEEKTLIFYVGVRGYLVQVRVKVERDDLTRRDFKVTHNQYGANVVRNEIVNQSGYFQHAARFASGSNDQPSEFVLWSY